MKKLLISLFFLLPITLPAQVKVKGIVTEANTNPAVKSVKKPLAGVQIKAMGAVAPEVTDNSGNFTLVFQGKKPGDLILGTFIQKNGYEVFNRDVLDNWKVSNDPNWIDKIKMCPAGTLDRLKAHNYESLYNTLLTQYEKQKGELKKLKISDADLNEKYRSLDEKFQSQQKQLAEYVERFVRIDFDEVSDLYRRAYSLFSKGDLDSVAVILEEADLISRTNKRISERDRITVVKTEAARQEEENEAGIKKDMEALKMLAQTYVMKFDYEKATPLYEQMVRLDSTNVDNLLYGGIFYSEVKNYGRAIHLFSKVISLTDTLDWHQGSAKRRIGELQKETGSFEPALKNFQESYHLYKSLSIRDSINEVFAAGLRRAIIDLGDIYLAMGRTEDALSYFKKYNSLIQIKLNSNINDPELKNLLTVSYDRLGSIHQSMGHMDQALKYFEEEFNLSKELYEANLKNESLKKGLAISYERLGDIHQTTGHTDQALKCFEEEVKLFMELYGTNSKNQDLKEGLTISYLNLGEIQQSIGHMDKALKYFEECSKLFKELAESNPKNESLKNGLAISFEKLGDIHRSMGHMEKALTYFEEEVKLFIELSKLNLKNENLKNGLASSYSKLGDIHMSMGYMNEALKYFEEVVEIFKELHESNPRSESLENNLAASFERLGSIHQAMGHMDQALKYFEDYNKLFKELCESNPQNEKLKQNLAVSYERLGSIHQAIGHTDQALKNYENYNSSMKELYELNPKNETLKSDLATSYLELGNLHKEMGQEEKALKYFEDYNKLFKELCESNPQNENLKHNLAVSYERLGSIHQMLENKDKALKYIEDYNRLIKELYESNPKNERLKSDLAISYGRLGDIYQSMGQMEEALKNFEDYSQLMSVLHGSNPKNENLKNNLADSYKSLGLIHQAMGHVEKALKYFEDYNGAMKDLCDSNPKNSNLKESLAYSYGRLGDIHQAMSHMEEALKYFEDYNKAMKVLYESNPSNASFKSNLANSNFNLGNIHQLMGHTEESLKNFKEVIKSTKDLYELNPKDINLYATLGILYSKVASLYKSKNNKDESAKNFYLTGKIYNNCFQQTRIGKYDIWKNVCLSELDTICRNHISEADTLLQHSFSDKARVIYLKADSLYLKKNELSQNVDNIWNRGWICERLSACAADYNEKLILLEKALELRLEVYRSYPNENTHPVVINTYGNLAWYYILSKKYSKSESATLTAIEIGQKNKIEESQYNWVYTNLAHSLLFQGKFEEAKKIYLEMKDKVYPQDTTKTFRYFFLKDFDDLKQAGITHPDVSKIRELLK